MGAHPKKLSSYLKNSCKFFEIKPLPNRLTKGNEILKAKKYVFCSYAYQISVNKNCFFWKKGHFWGKYIQK